MKETDYLYQGLLGVSWLIRAGQMRQAETAMDKLLERFDNAQLQNFYNSEYATCTKEVLLPKAQSVSD